MDMNKSCHCIYCVAGCMYKSAANKETIAAQRVSMEKIIWLLFALEMAMVVSGVENFTRDHFPTDFVFGAGASAYQVEGAAFEDGRKASIWDTFVHSDTEMTRIVFDGETGDIACDQYHKYKEDVQLMAETGLEAYRFSISWSRLIPDGNGPVNPKGLQYYNNLINELIKNGIQPHITLYHIDTPQALEDEYNGWLSRKMVRDFTNYADVCFKEFGDRVSHWTTLNEVNVFTIGGYDLGFTPPGRCSTPFGIFCNNGNSITEPYIAGHNLLLAHSSVVKLYRRKYKATQNGFVGLNLFGSWFDSSSNSTEDVIAAQRSRDFYIGWFLHPLVFGDYPDIVKKNAGPKLPVLSVQEVELVKGAFDFIGLNHYGTIYVKDNPSSLNVEIRDITADMEVTVSYNPFASPDEDDVDSSGLYNILQYLKTDYGNPPTYIHENGLFTLRNATLEDESRVKYMRSYMGTLLDALRNGANTKGYFVWSFLDGFEIFGGYRTGFGIYYVDLNDKELRRYPKLSAHWYSKFLKKGGNRIQNDANSAFFESIASQ